MRQHFAARATAWRWAPLASASAAVVRRIASRARAVPHQASGVLRRSSASPSRNCSTALSPAPSDASGFRRVCSCPEPTLLAHEIPSYGYVARGPVAAQQPRREGGGRERSTKSNSYTSHRLCLPSNIMTYYFTVGLTHPRSVGRPSHTFMSTTQNLKRALSAVDDAVSALNRARHTEDDDAASDIRRALRELDDAQTKIKGALRELPDD